MIRRDAGTPGRRDAGTPGRRDAGTPGRRDAGTPGRRDAVFGLSEAWLLHRDRPIATAIVLSHAEQLDRLRQSCPKAVPTAVVAGDPCFDRLLASAPDRDYYRRALGLTPGRKLLVVNSTWGRESLYGTRRDLIERLLAELPMDDYLVAGVFHPNIPHGHGSSEISRHLAGALRAGLIHVPPREGWRAVLTAADLVIGDHGSVPFYAAALGVPTMLAAFPEDSVDPLSPVGRFGAAAPFLSPDQPLRGQIEDLLAKYDPAVLEPITDQVTSFPGESLRLLRELCYRLLELPEPASPLRNEPVPALYASQNRVSAFLVDVQIDAAGQVAVERFPYAVEHYGPPRHDAHLVVDVTRPVGLYAEQADVLVRDALGAPDDWAVRALARYPGCRIAAVIDGAVCRITARDGMVTELLAPTGTDPSILASVAFHQLTSTSSGP